MLRGNRTPLLVVLMADLELARDRPIEAMRLIRSGLAEFPDNEELIIRFGEIYNRFEMTHVALTFFQRMVSLYPNSPELCWALINSELDEVKRIQLLDRYAENGGNDPKADLLALDLGAGDPEYLLKRFFDNGGGYRMELLTQLGEVLYGKPPALIKAALDHVVPYTGDRYVDTNEDEFYEEIYTYRDGILVRWTVDRNQDGKAEAVFHILENGFSSIAVHQPEEVTYRFDPYPLLRQVIYINDKGSVLYDMAKPPIKRLGVQEGLNTELNWPIKRMFIQNIPRIPDRYDVARHSYRVTEVARSEENPRRIWYLSEGSLVSVTEDRNSDGHMDYHLTFDSDRFWTGFEDLNGDGTFDTLEKWVDGVISSIAFDEDRDRRYEYFQLFGDSAGTDGVVDRWDFDENGIVDHESPLHERTRRTGVRIRDEPNTGA